ncbi:MAG: phosphoribosylglycinamide formyltransferase [Chromatiales bacterium]
MKLEKCPIVVLISGSGSNLQAIIDASADASYPAQVAAVISNKAGVKGLQRAESAGVDTCVVKHGDFNNREDYDAELMRQIDRFQPKLVVLAGFMRILTPAFVQHYQGRLLNIHPSLLPKYRGLHTHQQVLDSSDETHGASVHFVTEELDGGPLILQATVTVEADDDADSLAARVLQKEHIIYPLVIKWFAAGRLQMRDHRVLLDDRPLQQPLRLEQLAAEDC